MPLAFAAFRLRFPFAPLWRRKAAARAGGAMLDEDLKAGLIAAVRAAARARILPRFRALAEGEVATKSSHSDLVTRADTEAEADITAAVRALWPEAEVLGEEAISADKSLRPRMALAEHAVVIDPVDGTWNFAKGLTVFGMLLAVLHRGRPAWGMLYDPVIDDWIEAGAEGPAEMVTASGTRRVLRTSTETRIGRMTGYLALGLYPRSVQARIAAELPAFSRVSSLRCACHEYRMVAQGHVEFCLSGPSPHPWDHAAGALAVERAGGVVRFLDGSRYDASRDKGVILAAASEPLWQDLAGRFGYLG